MGAGVDKENRSSDFRVPICMVLLEEAVPNNPKQVEEILSRSLPPGSFSVEEGEGTAVVSWNGADFSVIAVGAPIPGETFAMQIDHGTGDQSGPKQAAERHKAHVIVSPLTQPTNTGGAISLSIGLMYFCNLLAQGMKPLGLFWSRSEVLVDWHGFQEALSSAREAMSRAQAGERADQFLPRDLWTGFRLYPSDGGTVGGFTTGLYVFVGYDVEIEPVRWPPGHVAQRLLGIIAYSLQAGPVLKDGDTLGISDTERFHIHMVETAPSGRRAVLTLGQA